MKGYLEVKHLMLYYPALDKAQTLLLTQSQACFPLFLQAILALHPLRENSSCAEGPLVFSNGLQKAEPGRSSGEEKVAKHM